MDNENSSLESTQMVPTDWKTRLTTVTSFSKYFALALFVALPFLGFWVGVEYAKAPTVTQEEPKAMIEEKEEVSVNNSTEFVVNELAYTALTLPACKESRSSYFHKMPKLGIEFHYDLKKYLGDDNADGYGFSLRARDQSVGSENAVLTVHYEPNLTRKPLLAYVSELSVQDEEVSENGLVEKIAVNDKAGYLLSLKTPSKGIFEAVIEMPEFFLLIKNDNFFSRDAFEYFLSCVHVYSEEELADVNKWWTYKKSIDDSTLIFKYPPGFSVNSDDTSVISILDPDITYRVENDLLPGLAMYQADAVIRVRHNQDQLSLDEYYRQDLKEGDYFKAEKVQEAEISGLPGLIFYNVPSYFGIDVAAIHAGNYIIEIELPLDSYFFQQFIANIKLVSFMEDAGECDYSRYKEECFSYEREGGWTRYKNVAFGFMMFYPDDYEVKYGGSLGSTEDFDYSVYNKDKKSIHLIGENPCHEGLCFKDSLETIQYGNITWNYLGKHQYCDVGECSYVSSAYSTTVSDDTVYFLFSNVATTTQHEVLSKFIFSKTFGIPKG